MAGVGQFDATAALRLEPAEVLGCRAVPPTSPPSWEGGQRLLAPQHFHLARSLCNGWNHGAATAFRGAESFTQPCCTRRATQLPAPGLGARFFGSRPCPTPGEA